MLIGYQTLKEINSSLVNDPKIPIIVVGDNKVGKSYMCNLFLKSPLLNESSDVEIFASNPIPMSSYITVYFTDANESRPVMHAGLTENSFLSSYKQKTYLNMPNPDMQVNWDLDPEQVHEQRRQKIENLRSNKDIALLVQQIQNRYLFIKAKQCLFNSQLLSQNCCLIDSIGQDDDITNLKELESIQEVNNLETEETEKLTNSEKSSRQDSKIPQYKSTLYIDDGIYLRIQKLDEGVTNSTSKFRILQLMNAKQPGKVYIIYNMHNFVPEKKQKKKYLTNWYAFLKLRYEIIPRFYKSIFEQRLKEEEDEKYKSQVQILIEKINKYEQQSEYLEMVQKLKEKLKSSIETIIEFEKLEQILNKKYPLDYVIFIGARQEEIYFKNLMKQEIEKLKFGIEKQVRQQKRKFYKILSEELDSLELNRLTQIKTIKVEKQGFITHIKAVTKLFDDSLGANFYKYESQLINAMKQITKATEEAVEDAKNKKLLFPALRNSRKKRFISHLKQKINRVLQYFKKRAESNIKQFQYIVETIRNDPRYNKFMMIELTIKEIYQKYSIILKSINGVFSEFCQMTQSLFSILGVIFSMKSIKFELVPTNKFDLFTKKIQSSVKLGYGMPQLLSNTLSLLQVYDFTKQQEDKLFQQNLEFIQYIPQILKNRIEKIKLMDIFQKKRQEMVYMISEYKRSFDYCMIEILETISKKELIKTKKIIDEKLASL